MALMEIQLKVCRFHGSLAKKIPNPCCNRSTLLFEVILYWTVLHYTVFSSCSRVLVSLLHI